MPLISEQPSAKGQAEKNLCQQVLRELFFGKRSGRVTDNMPLAVMMGKGEGRVTVNRWESQAPRDCVRKYFGFCFYPRRSGPRNRVEYAFSPFSSIRLSGGGKHGAHPPQWLIPLTLLSPLTPTSRRSSFIMMRPAHKLPQKNTSLPTHFLFSPSLSLPLSNDS